MKRRGEWRGRPFIPGKLAVHSSAWFSAMWFCFDQPGNEVFDERGRRVMYCGAPVTIRCACGSNRGGHDPGDEDARA